MQYPCFLVAQRNLHRKRGNVIMIAYILDCLLYNWHVNIKCKGKSPYEPSGPSGQSLSQQLPQQ